MDKIGETLRDARKSKRLTQTEVAKSVGVSRAYYADVERGRYNPSLKLMSKLAKLLSINLNFLKKNDGNGQKGHEEIGQGGFKGLVPLWPLRHCCPCRALPDCLYPVLPLLPHLPLGSLLLAG